jgi:hypothetical protein
MSAGLTTRFTNSDGTRNLTALFFQSPDADEVTVRIYNDSAVAIATNYLMVVRGDLIEAGLTIPNESAAVSNGVGEELVSDTWLEASLDGVIWTAVGGWADKLNLGAISAGGHVVIYLRLAPPSVYDSYGMISFALCCASTNE